VWCSLVCSSARSSTYIKSAVAPVDREWRRRGVAIGGRRGDRPCGSSLSVLLFVPAAPQECGPRRRRRTRPAEHAPGQPGVLLGSLESACGAARPHQSQPARVRRPAALSSLLGLGQGQSAHSVYGRRSQHPGGGTAEQSSHCTACVRQTSCCRRRPWR